ncbi:MAG TPA: ROK family protein [Acidimicrobiales bacterium]|nr:ROK family protein [Acidimicrobiales bacterium]
MSGSPTFGLDLGGTKCLGVAWQDGQVVAQHRAETETAGPGDVIELLAGVTGHLQTAAGAPRAIGIGAPGLVTAAGDLARAPNLPGVQDLALRSGFAEVVGVPVVVENDAATAAWAEFSNGAAAGANSMLAVTLGTGVGGGIVLDGRLVRGAHGFAAEIGHMTVREGGRPCVCGKRGCWEVYASGGALGRLAREHMGLSGEAATAAALRGEVEALVLLTEYAGEVALGLGSLVEVLDPEVVVIGGGLVEVGEALMAPIRSALPGFVYSWEHREPTPVVAAKLGERAGAIGAALLAAERT